MSHIHDVWKVNVKGSYYNEDEPGYEIAVVHVKNKHGLTSWGWGDENKLIIVDSISNCDKKYFDKFIKRAHIFNENKIPYTRYQ